MNLTALDRTSAAAGLAFVAATVVAWVGLAGYEPPMGPAGFLAGWTLMICGVVTLVANVTNQL